MPSKRPDRAKSHGASVFSLVFVLSPPRDAVSRNCTVGFLSQILILSCNFRSYFVRLSACISPVGTQWIWLGDSTCCTLLTLINDLFSDSEGFSATSESYKDLAPTTCTIGSDMLPLKAGFNVKFSVKKKFNNEERSARSSAAIASAAKVERQMRGLLPVFQSTKCPATVASFICAGHRRMRTPNRRGNILGINFFLWFQLEVETFQVGWAVPAEEVGLKKQLARGLGAPFQMHSENMQRDSPSVRMIFGALGPQFLFGALGSYNLGALGS